MPRIRYREPKQNGPGDREDRIVIKGQKPTSWYHALSMFKFTLPAPGSSQEKTTRPNHARGSSAKRLVAQAMSRWETRANTVT
jgi:hypothetical protein